MGVAEDGTHKMELWIAIYDGHGVFGFGQGQEHLPHAWMISGSAAFTALWLFPHSHGRRADAHRDGVFWISLRHGVLGEESLRSGSTLRNGWAWFRLSFEMALSYELWIGRDGRSERFVWYCDGITLQTFS